MSHWIYDVIVAGKLLLDAHLPQILFTDEPRPTEVDSEEDSVLAIAGCDGQPLKLTFNLPNKGLQLTWAKQTFNKSNFT